MSPISNPSVLFNEVPKGEPTLETLKFDESAQIDLDAELEDNEIILKLVCVSLDPYMRGRMRPEHIKSYSPAFPLNKPIGGHGVAKVIKSKASRYPEGTHIYGVLPYTTYIRRIAPTEKEDEDNAKFFGGPALRILKNEENLSWSTYVGAAGMPGKTAFMAWKEFSGTQNGKGQAKVAYISAGSGPVGSLAIQMAKRDGYKVIASAGSDKKIQFCKDIGADVVFNYKSDDPAEIFAKEAPEGIDVNWVNVGGKAFEAELAHSALHGRVIVCGWISAYNGKSDGITNLFQIVAKRLQINGFIVGDLEPKYSSEFYSTVPKALASGEVKFSEVKYSGLDKIPQAFIDLLAGKQGGGDGIGKVVIEIA